MKTDILGKPFEAIEIDLPDDEEGKVLATLIRCRSQKRSKKAVLYIHGYIDYFFQKELANQYIENNFNFYALDLRKYGRSLLAHQTPNFCKNINEYFVEIGKAIEIIKNDGNESILLNGHSTGGLISSLYTNEHNGSGDINALFLNSPFFEFNEGFLARKVVLEIIGAIGEINPYNKIPGGLSELYARSVHKDYNGEWDFNLDWKPLEGFNLVTGWLRAILEGQRILHAGLNITCPVLVMFSDKSCYVDEWDEKLLISDSVLNVEHISKYADFLGDHITKIRIKDAMHDIILSRKDVRDKAYKHLFTWLKAYVP